MKREDIPGLEDSADHVTLKSEKDRDRRMSSAIVQQAWSHVKADAKAGFFVALLLLVLRFYGESGRHAFHEVYQHFVFVHPLIWLLATTAVCYLNAFQGADLLDDVATAFVRPILGFVAHPSGVALGMMPILLSVEGLPKGVQGAKWLACLLIFFVPALLATLSHLGLAIADKKGPGATKRQVRRFAIFAVLGTFAVFYFAGLDLTAESAINTFPAGAYEICDQLANCAVVWYKSFTSFLA